MYLENTFGAVLKGFKTRRIFNKNKVINQLRYEFRDLIQFAFNLKTEITQTSSKSKNSS